MYRIQILLAFALLLAFAGCSSEKSPVTPDPTSQHLSKNLSNRSIWGYWTIKIDPDTSSVEIIPDRDMASHFNVVRLLEVTPCTDCLTINNLSWLPDNIVRCDFQVRHPFPGLLKFTAFDVRGVLVTNGDTIFPENNRLASLDSSNPTLLNPDGYTSLFNPVEFPEGSSPFPILEYIPGKFSFGDNFTATLNPFMAFGKNNPRRMFEAGSAETITINLKYPSAPFEFGYAVDASWILLDEVSDPLTDFPPGANCLEPYQLSCQPLSSITNKTGSTAQMRVEVFDHQGLDTISTVSIECPSLFNGEVFLDFPSPAGDDSWLYDGEITNQNGAPVGSYPMLVRALSNDDDFNLGELAAYRVSEIDVQQYVSPGGDLYWAKRAGGLNQDAGRATTTLSDDSTVITGYFTDTATFGEDEINETQLVSNGEGNVFIARYNPDGTLVWAKSTSCENSSSAFGITTLSDDSTVITGFYNESITFGEGEPNETVLEMSGYACLFVSRFNPDGTLAWAKRVFGDYRNVGYAITSLSDDSTIVTGYISGTSIFGYNEPNETILEKAVIGRDTFVARFNPDGTLAWVKRPEARYSDRGWDLTTLSDDTFVVTGEFSGDAVFGEGDPNETNLDNDGVTHLFLARYNPDGTLVWAKQPGGAFSCGEGITTLSDDSQVVTGWILGPVIFGEGEPGETFLDSLGDGDVFIAHYNPDGSLVWAKQAGGTQDEKGSGATTLSDNSTVIIGRYENSATFGIGEANETVLIAEGAMDIFLARYDPDGTLAWVKRAGGAGPYDGDHGTSVTTLSDDSTVSTGVFMGSATFGEYEPHETVLVSDGYSDIFIARYGP